MNKKNCDLKDHSSYSLLLLANDTYFRLLYICIKSICVVCKMEKINKIYIADLGLCNNYQKTLEDLSDKIEIISTKTNIGNSKKLYSKDWIDAVSQKTAVLLMLIEKNNTPIIMLDSDTIIIEDFSSCIDFSYDIQICKRTRPLFRKDGFVLEYIASFFIANNIKARTFVIAWVNRLAQRVKSEMLPPHETPAMVDILRDNTELKIGFLDENVVSCENNYIKNITKIIHAKSRTPNDCVSIYRFANVKRLPHKKILNLFDSFYEKILFIAVYVFKKIFSLYDLKKKIKHILGNFT